MNENQKEGCGRFDMRQNICLFQTHYGPRSAAIYLTRYHMHHKFLYTCVSRTCPHCSYTFSCTFLLTHVHVRKQQVCSTLDADRRRLFNMLKEELLTSIYDPSISKAKFGVEYLQEKETDFMKSVPFFSLIAGLYRWRLVSIRLQCT